MERPMMPRPGHAPAAQPRPATAPAVTGQAQPCAAAWQQAAGCKSRGLAAPARSSAALPPRQAPRVLVITLQRAAWKTHAVPAGAAKACNRQERRGRGLKVELREGAREGRTRQRGPVQGSAARERGCCAAAARDGGGATRRAAPLASRRSSQRRDVRSARRAVSAGGCAAAAAARAGRQVRAGGCETRGLRTRN